MNKLLNYVIALYIRLSIEDSKVESMSIENQKRALHSFVDRMEGVRNIEVLEFIDNGYSGTNFERPAVQKLLGQVQAGEINCIIVKDFTRFGRNAIEVGYFMERVFPLYGIRFISINDDFDSARLHGDTGGLDVAFKYLVAEFYSRDLSVKSKSAKYVKMKRGEYQSKICPYGYRKGPDGRMEPDEETAPVVRLIFELAKDGHSTPQIARALLEKGIQTPGERKAAKGIVQHDVSRSGGIWQTSTLRHILTDERYTGTYIMGKRAVREVGSYLVRTKDESEWFKIPDHHPPIISKELFQQVQERFPRTTCVKKQAHRYPLWGKVFCGVCSHAMSRTSNKNHTFYCRHSQVDKNAPCHGLHISEAELEGVLYEIMNKQAQIILNLNDLSDAEPLDVHLAKQGDYLKQIDGCQDQKRILYEQMLLGEIGTEEYKAEKTRVDKELGRLNRIYDALCRQTEQMRMGDESKAARKKLAQEVTGAGGLTAALVDALIERVEVCPENQVRIIWKIKDFCMEA